MKKIVIVCAALLVMTPMVGSAASVVGSAHDLSSGGSSTFVANNVDRVCVFCHVPHGGMVNSPAPNQLPLWNHTLSTEATYTVYTSVTLDANPTNFANAGVIATSTVSNLCMSCHDGSVGVGTLYADGGQVDGVTPSNAGAGNEITGAALLGTVLVDDHPVNFTYDAALVTADGGTGLATPDSTQWVDATQTIPLFGGTVQCASCHTPHDPANVPFLRVSNSASALCRVCHTK